MVGTIFESRLLVAVLRKISYKMLGFMGWKIDCPLPLHSEKCVLAGGPHRTWRDLLYSLLVAFALGLNLRWVGKRSLFRFPFGWIMSYLGGLPVNRESRNGFVESAADMLLKASTPIQLLVSPEGTRKEVKEWRTGYYHVAKKANVPIVLAKLNYEKKEVYFVRTYGQSGNNEEDLRKIREQFERMG